MNQWVFSRQEPRSRTPPTNEGHVSFSNLSFLIPKKNTRKNTSQQLKPKYGWQGFGGTRIFDDETLCKVFSIRSGCDIGMKTSEAAVTIFVSFCPKIVVCFQERGPCLGIKSLRVRLGFVLTLVTPHFLAQSEFFWHTNLDREEFWFLKIQQILSRDSSFGGLVGGPTLEPQKWMLFHTH